jgi:hypothetical protein
MNYCKENRIQAGTSLSALDKSGIRAFYAEKPQPGQPEIGRPEVYAPGPDSVDDPVMGLPSGVQVAYPEVKERSRLPRPESSLTLTDGKTSVLALPAWRASGDGLATAGRFTPAVGAERRITFTWNGVYAGDARVRDVSAGFREKPYAEVPGPTFELHLEVRARPGIVPQAVARAEIEGGAALQLQTTCLPAAHGLSCRVRSTAPVASGKHVRVEAKATGGRTPAYSDVMVLMR